MRIPTAKYFRDKIEDNMCVLVSMVDIISNDNVVLGVYGPFKAVAHLPWKCTPSKHA